jgi:methylated-DNA-[protein]-cysteine S-methyltransferase
LTDTSARWRQISPVGPLVVVASDAGIISVSFESCTSPGRIDMALAQRIDAYFQGDLDALADVPVDVSGLPPFRQEVLTALRDVRGGTFTSYGKLAVEIGRPGAARAVGQAVATNPIPVVIPCHRVLAADGSLGGFSGGLERKRWLLTHEQIAVKGAGWRAKRAPVG